MMVDASKCRAHSQEDMTRGVYLVIVLIMGKKGLESINKYCDPVIIA